MEVERGRGGRRKGNRGVNMNSMYGNVTTRLLTLCNKKKNKITIQGKRQPPSVWKISEVHKDPN
jgi:hypothetical protein